MVGGRTRTGFAGKRRQKLRELQAHTTNDFLAANAFREQVRVNAFLGGEADCAPGDVLPSTPAISAGAAATSDRSVIAPHRAPAGLTRWPSSCALPPRQA